MNAVELKKTAMRRLQKNTGEYGAHQHRHRTSKKTMNMQMKYWY